MSSITFSVCFYDGCKKLERRRKWDILLPFLRRMPLIKETLLHHDIPENKFVFFLLVSVLRLKNIQTTLIPSVFIKQNGQR